MPFLLAQTDIGGVPAEYVKNFFIMLAFIGGLYLSHRKGAQSKGTKDDPVNVAQPLEIKKRTEYAPKEEVSRLQEWLEELTRAGDERGSKIIEALHKAEHRMLDEIKSLHERLNPVAEQTKAQGATLTGIGERLLNLETGQRDEVRHMHQRIDDFIRLASSNSNKTKA